MLWQAGRNLTYTSALSVQSSTSVSCSVVHKMTPGQCAPSRDAFVCSAHVSCRVNQPRLVHHAYIRTTLAYLTALPCAVTALPCAVRYMLTVSMNGQLAATRAPPYSLPIYILDTAVLAVR